RLGARGHAVTIVAPTEWPGPAPRRSPRQRLAALGRYLLANRRVAWFDLDVALKIVPSLAERHVPDADVTIATYWRTAEAQAQYGPRKGVPVYFIQGYEIWGGAREEVEATYRGPAIKFAVSSWLKRLLRDRFDQDPVGPMVQGDDRGPARRRARPEEISGRAPRDVRPGLALDRSARRRRIPPRPATRRAAQDLRELRHLDQSELARRASAPANGGHGVPVRGGDDERGNRGLPRSR